MIHTIPHDIIRIVFSLLDDASFVSFGSTNKLLQYLSSLINPNKMIDIHELVITAIQYGFIDLFRLYTKPLTCYSEKTMILFCNTAIEHGQFEILKWFRTNFNENGYHWSKLTCTKAAENGHFEILKWLRTEFNENGDNSVCNYYKISV